MQRNRKDWNEKGGEVVGAIALSTPSSEIHTYSRILEVFFTYSSKLIPGQLQPQFKAQTYNQ
jgi:hypothetical protein